MNADVMFECLQTALDVFYRRDKRLVKIGGSERTCAARIAGYLQHILDVYGYDNDLFVDCEYGKATDESGAELRKHLDSNGAYADTAAMQQDRVFPDIIVHNRGTHANNLLVIELKGYWHNKNDWGKDEEKLKIFTREHAPSENLRPYFHYELGVFVALGKTQAHFVRFKNGQQVNTEPSISDLFRQKDNL